MGLATLIGIIPEERPVKICFQRKICLLNEWERGDDELSSGQKSVPLVDENDKAGRSGLSSFGKQFLAVPQSGAIQDEVNVTSKSRADSKILPNEKSIDQRSGKAPFSMEPFPQSVRPVDVKQLRESTVNERSEHVDHNRTSYMISDKYITLLLNTMNQVLYSLENNNFTFQRSEQVANIVDTVGAILKNFEKLHLRQDTNTSSPEEIRQRLSNEFTKVFLQQRKDMAKNPLEDEFLRRMTERLLRNTTDNSAIDEDLNDSTERALNETDSFPNPPSFMSSVDSEVDAFFSDRNDFYASTENSQSTSGSATVANLPQANDQNNARKFTVTQPVTLENFITPGPFPMDHHSTNTISTLSNKDVDFPDFPTPQRWNFSSSTESTKVPLAPDMSSNNFTSAEVDLPLLPTFVPAVSKLPASIDFPTAGSQAKEASMARTGPNVPTTSQVNRSYVMPTGASKAHDVPGAEQTTSSSRSYPEHVTSAYTPSYTTVLHTTASATETMAQSSVTTAPEDTGIGTVASTVVYRTKVTTSTTDPRFVQMNVSEYISPESDASSTTAFSTTTVTADRNEEISEVERLWLAHQAKMGTSSSSTTTTVSTTTSTTTEAYSTKSTKSGLSEESNEGEYQGPLFESTPFIEPLRNVPMTAYITPPSGHIDEDRYVSHSEIPVDEVITRPLHQTRTTTTTIKTTELITEFETEEYPMPEATTTTTTEQTTATSPGSSSLVPRNYFSWSLSFKDIAWNIALRDPSSWQYKRLYEDLQPQLAKVFKSVLKNDFLATTIKNFSEGSVTVNGETDTVRSLETKPLMKNFNDFLSQASYYIGVHEINPSSIKFNGSH
ncbi:unnamed protein product [Soboliphyme baturini]|uniref:SEA domain-containing protein n=1 Tax=Soboliphyme baturini TaxID=241478 RepID=A0A183IWI6_9BILA|nr:unnamed protein product [Soboliphyme baturini]